MKRFLLLTGTIDASVFNVAGNKIVSTEDRLTQYSNAILNYIENSPFDNIVFADNSNYPFDETQLIKIAEKRGKRFEFVKCEPHVLETIEGGKSYGEAILITEALSKSVLLEEAETIYKITGRIFLKNSKAICKTEHSYRNEYIVYMGKKWCFTNIFKFNKEDYLQFWKESYTLCNERKGNDIERVFYKILENAVIQGKIDVGSFRAWPYLDGVQGATLEPYSGNWGERLLRNIMAYLGFFSYNSFFARMFKKYI